MTFAKDPGPWMWLCRAAKSLPGSGRDWIGHLPAKAQAGRAGPGCFGGDNVLQLLSACQSQASASGAGTDGGFGGQKPTWISVREVFLKSCKHKS